MRQSGLQETDVVPEIGATELFSAPPAEQVLQRRASSARDELLYGMPPVPQLR
jgi:hypothetical protein